MTIPSLGTTKAADLLGLSTASVQKLVDNGQLVGWKTSGGHRRILTSSIIEFQIKQNQPLTSNNKEDFKRTDIIIISKYLSEKLSIFNNILAEYPSIRLVQYTTAAKALMYFSACNPFLIIFDIDDTKDNVHEFVEAIKSFQNNHPMFFIGLTNDASKLDINYSKLFIKVINFDSERDQSWLTGFIQSSILTNIAG